MHTDDPGTFRNDAEEAQRSASRKGELGGLFIVTLCCFALGTWSFDPYLERELQRVEPWKALLTSTGDMLALAWFGFFVVRHYVLGHPLEDQPWAEFKRQRVWQLALLSFLLGFALDLAISVSLMYEDRALFTTAEVTTGQADKVARYSEKHPTYMLQCSYLDKQGQQHSGLFTVDLQPPFPAPPPPFPAPVRQAMEQGQAPFAVRISYDPTWPARSWLTDYGRDDVNRLHYFSFVLFFFQFGSLFLFVVVGGTRAKDYPHAPWWVELHQVVPFMGQVFFMAFAGPFYRYKLWSLSML